MKRPTLLTTILVAASFSAGSAQASFITNITQVGANVVATGSGTIDTAGLTNNGSSSTSGSGVEANQDLLFLGPPASVTAFGGITGPASFGPGGTFFSSSDTGNTVGLTGPTLELLLPTGYVSESPLSATDTFNNTTIAGLGLTPGTYTYTFGSGATADSYILNILRTSTAVPEPASTALLALGLAALLCAKRRAHPQRRN